MLLLWPSIDYSEQVVRRALPAILTLSSRMASALAQTRLLLQCDAVCARTPKSCQPSDDVAEPDSGAGRRMRYTTQATAVRAVRAAVCRLGVDPELGFQCSAQTVLAELVRVASRLLLAVLKLPWSSAGQ